MKNHPYLPHTEEDIKNMLKELDVSSIDDLFSDVPKTVSLKELKIPEGLDEYSVLKKLKELAGQNISLENLKVFLGAGIYYRYIPSVVHQLASKPGFLTAYTPYQAEVSQGTLQALFEYQTMMCELTGMEVANASMYDGASALAEAMLMSVRISKKGKVVLSKTIHPEYRETVKTYLLPQGIDVIEVGYDDVTGETDINELKKVLNEDIGSFAVQYPNFFGVIEDIKKLREILPERVVFVVVSDPIALALLEPPGKFNVDIVVGEGQMLGNFPSLGGPGFGFFATKMKHIRTMPGRLIGMAEDSEGNRGYVMILQTREQHIRRSRATSNICSNHAHSALVAAIYMSTLGKSGIVEVAKRSANAAHYLKMKLEEKGYKPRFTGPFLYEFVIRFGDDYEKVWEDLFKEGILGPLPLGRFYPELQDSALAATTELTTREDIDALLEAIP